MTSICQCNKIKPDQSGDVLQRWHMYPWLFKNDDELKTSLKKII